MTSSTIRLRHICFTGPEKPSAKLDFAPGLNVLYGASETGKSFVLEAIDFMLGGKTELRDIPERIGYDRIWLGLEAEAEGGFTLTRAVSGGQFQLFEGLHDAAPSDATPTVLTGTHNAKKANNVSRFLLAKIGLDTKVIRKNATETRSLSFRDLCHICLVGETDIQKQGSPLETGQVVQRTAEYALFKLLLTGVDDSALVSTARESSAFQARAAKLEVIDELIAAQQERISESGEDRQELDSQLERLAASIVQRQQALRSAESDYQIFLSRRNEIRKKLESGEDRRSQLDELLERFRLLDEHYRSDIARLEATREAGSLLGGLPQRSCPLCGTPPEHQHRSDDCDGDIERIVVAADAEGSKIVRLRSELEDTVQQLQDEARSFDRLIPKLRVEQKKLEEMMTEMRPGIQGQRSSYTELIEERAEVTTSLAMFAQLEDLQTRRKDFDRASEGEGSPRPMTDLSSTTLDQFAQHVERLLKAWNFPDADRVNFQESDRDVIIHGKRRSSRGKGMRAITHAAFILGLMEFCKAQNRQHPGFVVLDSPLLAYREPEGAEDDLTGTDVQDRFYDYLAAAGDRQVIVIENLDPPDAIKKRSATTFFSKSPHQDRYGFFPAASLWG